jgi:hypothetical protein
VHRFGGCLSFVDLHACSFALGETGRARLTADHVTPFVTPILGSVWLSVDLLGLIEGDDHAGAGGVDRVVEMIELVSVDWIDQKQLAE